MKTVEIRHYWTNAVIYTTEVEDDDPFPIRTALNRASLVGASLVGASLDGASLVGASLDGARLDGARLDGIRDDIRAILDAAPNEVPGLLLALTNGTIDGSCYTGQCACLVGTIAKVRGVELTPSGHGLPGITPAPSRPAECWFMALRPGHTPDNHPVAAITYDWIAEWLAERGVGPWFEVETEQTTEVQP